jgi:hypothetical protein
MSHLVSMRVGRINLGRAPLHGCKLELGHANGSRKLQTRAQTDEPQDIRDTDTRGEKRTVK